MKLTPNDIYEMENKTQDFNKPSDQVFCSTNFKIVDQDDEEDQLEEAGAGYNPNWTLRKCCSKLIDRLSNLYPLKLYELVRPVLEIEMQHSDWAVKEKSILTLGAIAIGCYEHLKPHLAVLISFLIRELQNPHKLVRAISCWTLSRFNKFILIDNKSENSNELFKEYLCEILKRFFDNEIIVQEAVCTAFSSMLVLQKEKLEPYLFDIFKIMTGVFNKYTGTSLISLYDIISLLTQCFPQNFQNQTLIDELVICIVNKWCDIIKVQDYKGISQIFELINSVIKSSGNHYYINQFFDNFLNGCLIIIEFHYNSYVYNKLDANFLELDLISKSIDLISLLCQIFPTKIKETPEKSKIIKYFFKLIDINEFDLKIQLIGLIGDLSKADNSIISSRFNEIINLLFKYLELFEENKIENLDKQRILICSKSCWTIGLVALISPDESIVYVPDFLKKLLKILSLPRLNKSLAQNICICIGRLALIDPLSISYYLDTFLKQFCLTLRYIKDSPEKREVFSGLCSSILHNPNGVMIFFVFLCDAICEYDDAPQELENVFQKIIISYKCMMGQKWMDYFKLLPDKLKVRMKIRFSIEDQ